MERFEAIVVGLGAHGSAAAAALARRGRHVLGLERFARGEGRGASGGWTRMIRIAHFEHPWLVPLAEAAWTAWAKLEQETGSAILTQTGGLYAGPPDSALVTGALAGSRDHGLDHEVLDAAEIHRRWPIFEPPDDTVGVFEVRAGALRADRANAAHLALAEDRGADLRFGARVVNWRPAPGGGVEVETEDGAVIGAEQLVLTAGPWIADLVPDLRLPLTIEREVPMWFEPTTDPAAVGADRMPIWVLREDDVMYYGIPYDPDLGLKASIHHWGTFGAPDEIDRTVSDANVARVRSWLRRRMPAANGRLVHAEVCLYANMPDETFVIDCHPAALGIAFASACSGHGYKFGPVVGDILADLVTTGSSSWPIQPFRLARLQPTSETAG